MNSITAFRGLSKRRLNYLITTTMHILALVSLAVTATLPIVGGAALDFDFGPTIFAVLNKDLTSKNHYGSPLPPWEHGSKPGWYFGPHPGSYPGVPCLNSVSAFGVFIPSFLELNIFFAEHLRLAQVLPRRFALPA